MSLSNVSIQENYLPLYNEPDQKTKICLNDIIKESLIKARLIQNPNVVVRWGNLPDINGDTQHFRELFDCIISVLVDTDISQEKLFLNIDGEEERVLSHPDGKSFTRRVIRFHSTRDASSEWKSQCQQKLDRCGEIISNYGGSFMVNNIGDTGCLLFIMLPG